MDQQISEPEINRVTNILKSLGNLCKSPLKSSPSQSSSSESESESCGSNRACDSAETVKICACRMAWHTSCANFGVYRPDFMASAACSNPCWCWRWHRWLKGFRKTFVWRKSLSTSLTAAYLVNRPGHINNHRNLKYEEVASAKYALVVFSNHHKYEATQRLPEKSVEIVFWAWSPNRWIAATFRHFAT